MRGAPFYEEVQFRRTNNLIREREREREMTEEKKEKEKNKETKHPCSPVATPHTVSSV